MSELDTTFNSEENTNQENETEVFEQGENSNAEGAKIAAILERKNKKIAELEAQLKNSATEKKVEKVAQKQNTTLSREEAILFAKGLSEEEVEEAKYVSEREGISIFDATNHPRFTSWKNSIEENKRIEKATIGTSNGTRKVPEQKTFDSKGLTGDEHLELFNKRMGK